MARSLHNLSAAFDAAVAPLRVELWCERCGGPDGAGIVITRSELARCERCGLELRADGRCAWGRRGHGEVELRVVLLHKELPRKPELPDVCFER